MYFQFESLHLNPLSLCNYIKGYRCTPVIVITSEWTDFLRYRCFGVGNQNECDKSTTPQCLSSPLVSGCIKVAVCSQLPVEGITFILRNYLAGEKAFPSLEVVDDPVVPDPIPVTLSTFVYHACAITRSQTRKICNIVDVTGSFVTSLNKDDCSVLPEEKSKLNKCETNAIP